jgi:hypothetical protein
MTWTLRLLTPALLLAFACTPKAGETDDEGDLESTGAESTAGGSTTSGDSVTTGDDPTKPPTASEASGDDTGTASSPPNPTVDTTTPGTSVSSVSDTEGSDEATSVGTFTSTSNASVTGTDTDTGPIEPPQPCEGEAMDIVAETIIAFNESQKPPQPDPTASDTGSSDSGGPNPPDTLYLRMSSQQFMCEDPAASLACGPNWDITIIILPEFQFPGLHSLQGDTVFAVSSETCAPEGNECCFGGGTFDGTLELINITDTTVEGRLCNTQGFFSETDPQLDGKFVAQRCQ